MRLKLSRELWFAFSLRVFGGLVSGGLLGCQASDIGSSDATSRAAERESSIRDICAPGDQSCAEVIHSVRGGRFSHVDEKFDSTTFTVSLGYFGGIVDAGIDNKFEFTIETEKSLSVFVDWVDPQEDQYVRDDSYLNFGPSGKTLWMGRCQQTIKKINARSTRAFALVFRSGAQYKNEIVSSMEAERWRLFKVIKDPKVAISGKYKGLAKSQYTIKEMYDDCFSENPRIFGDQTEIMKKDLENWAKQNLVIQAKSFGLYNNTGSHVVVRAPDGRKFFVGTRRNLSFERTGLNKPFYVYNPIFGSCYKWTPSRLDFNYWAVLKTPGIGGCQHGAGCLDVQDDAEAPTYHHHGAVGPCEGLQTCTVSDSADESQAGVCEK